MRRCLHAALCALIVAAPSTLHAQSFVQTSAAKLRMLDRVTGIIEDIDMQSGIVQNRGRISFELIECRHEAESLIAGAQAYVRVVDNTSQNTILDAWMIAESPALSALDHSRYDLWVLSCLPSA